MVSRISNPSLAENTATDYMQALNSVKCIDQPVFVSQAEELKVEDIFEGSSGAGVKNYSNRRIVHKPINFTQEEEKTLEK